MDRAVLETSSDRYVIVEYLAEGGMGAIYLGKKLGVGGFEKEVVLKQLLPEFTREPKFIGASTTGSRRRPASSSVMRSSRRSPTRTRSRRTTDGR
ncbi:MAG: hypothetical protein LC659_03745 [Myxococcales bacterium]|nr:hypothetical protein [Myxococcales bacterium]